MTEVNDGPVTRRDLAEGKIERVMTEKTALIPMGEHVGGLRFDNALQMAEAAKLMATAGPLLPPWLQGNVGGCWGIILKADELGVSPLTLASQTYLVVNKGVEQVAYMSNFYHSIIEARAPIKERIRARYEGDGDDRICFVYATFKGETEPREWPPKDSAKQFTLANLRPPLNEYGKRKGSPLWDTKPDQQMFYAMVRDWARVYCPDIIAGIYARDDFPEAEDVKVVSDTRATPGLAARLRGPGGEGFGQAIDASIAAAMTVDTRKNKNPATSAPAVSSPEGSEVGTATEPAAPVDQPTAAGAAPIAEGAT
jgi:hypothetical protein